MPGTRNKETLEPAQSDGVDQTIEQKVLDSAGSGQVSTGTINKLSSTYNKEQAEKAEIAKRLILKLAVIILLVWLAFFLYTKVIKG